MSVRFEISVHAKIWILTNKQRNTHVLRFLVVARHEIHSKTKPGKMASRFKTSALGFFVCSITAFYTVEASGIHDQTAHSDSFVYMTKNQHIKERKTHFSSFSWRRKEHVGGKARGKRDMYE